MTRLEKSKKRLTRVLDQLDDPIQLKLIYQELINQLPTYKEQKELYEHFESLTKKEKTKA